MSDCKWPECDGNHDRCAVLLACLDQVPLFLEDGGDWYRSQKWCEDHGYHWNHGENAWDVAEQVADRLLAWLRWPGVTSSVRRRTEGQTFRLPWRGSVYSMHTGQSFELRDEAVLRIDRMSPSEHFWRVVSMDRSGRDVLTVLACDVPNHAPVDRDGGATWHEAGEPVHPLDGTDVAGFRPAGLASFTELTDGEMAETGWIPDWPAVAVVADYLSSCGGWQWVHEFREPPDVKAIEARWEHAIDTGTLLNAQE